MDFRMHTIGIIHTPFRDIDGTPIQSSRSTANGTVVIEPQYAEGLQDVEGFSHIYLIYVFHCSMGYELKVTPFLDDNPRGLFATRYPCRPNQVGFSIVKLIARRGNVLEFEGADMLDETPLLDIKPYIPEFDAITDARTGWYYIRSKK